MSGARAIAAQAQTLLFIILLSDAGGAGKSTLARVLISIFNFAMIKPALFDCDQGNGMLSKYEPHAIKLGWGITPAEGIAELANCEGRHIILDVGANTLASKREIVGTIHAMIAEAQRKGYRCISILPQTPNKRGAAEMLVQLANTLPPCEKVIVHNNQNGAGQFEKLTHSYPVIDLDYLSPGYMEWVDSVDGSSFATAILMPPADRIQASLNVARWIRNFVKQLPSHEVFTKAQRILEKFEAPKRTYFRPLTASVTTDSDLEEMEGYTLILDLLRKHGRSPDGLRKAADELEQASASA